MDTIADRLNAVKQVKTDIKNAIADKGLYMEDVPFTEYAGKVAMIGATEIKPLEVTENGIYKSDEGIAFRPVTVNVPIPKVIPFTFNENGVYDVAVAATVKYGETFTLEYQIDFNAFTQAIEDMGIQLGEVFIADGDNYTLTYDSITFKVFGSNLPTTRQTMVLRKDGNTYAYITHENSDQDAWYVIREGYIAPATGMTITLPEIEDGETHTVRHTDIINEFVFTKSITEQGIAGANPITVDVKPNPVPLTVTENGVHENEQGFSPVTVNIQGTLKQFIDTFQEASYLFYYKITTDENVASVIKYDDTENATSMANMFRYSKGIKNPPLFNMKKVINAMNMFNTSEVEVVPTYDFRNVSSSVGIFTGCSTLRECWIKNIQRGIQVGSGTTYGHLLTVESLIHLIYQLVEYPSMQVLTIGSANLEKLTNVYVRTIDITDEMREEDDLIDKKLPFEVCESTDEGAIQIVEYAKLKNWNIA
jgi:hypothetical protein